MPLTLLPAPTDSKSYLRLWEEKITITSKYILQGIINGKAGKAATLPKFSD